MSQREPGLDVHEWETRWQELEPMFEDDPSGALPEACDFVERVLAEAGIDVDGVGGDADELVKGYAAARETADRVERGEDVGPGDLGAAIENLRAVFESLRVSRQT